MNKKEINELKKRYRKDNVTISRICGCYVDGEKNKVLTFNQSFLTLPEEEEFKYFEIFKKTMSGNIGKNLFNLDFPLYEEKEGGTQEFLLRLRDSECRDEELLDSFYDQVIANYACVDNYLILLIFDAYDVPGRTEDNLEMEDASEEVYRYILCSICPVTLTKPGLSYNPLASVFENSSRIWMVGMPMNGFLFPAFNDRSTDIHSCLYYSRDDKELQGVFIDCVLGGVIPASAGSQKEIFQTLVEETLGESCEYEAVRSIGDTIQELVEEHEAADIPEPVTLTKEKMKDVFAESGIVEEKIEKLEEVYERVVPENMQILAENVTNRKTFEVKTDNISIRVKPEYAHMVETKIVDGKKCLVIAIDENVVVNGIAVARFELPVDK